MTTNFIAVILTVLVTNASEHIAHRPDLIYRDLWLPNLPPPIKQITTEIYEQRLLVCETEGVTFTNIIKSTRQLWKQETYRQSVPLPEWVLDSNQTQIVIGAPTNAIWSNIWIFNFATNMIITTNNWIMELPKK